MYMYNVHLHYMLHALYIFKLLILQHGLKSETFGLAVLLKSGYLRNPFFLPKPKCIDSKDTGIDEKGGRAEWKLFAFGHKFAYPMYSISHLP